MDPVREYIDVKMIRENLDNIPEYSLPSGYSIRWYRRGYEKHWQAVQSLLSVGTRILGVVVNGAARGGRGYAYYDYRYYRYGTRGGELEAGSEGGAAEAAAA